MAIAAFASMFASCSSDDELFTPSDMVQIQSALIATETQTRVNTLAQGNSFENGDRILLVNNSRSGLRGEGTYTASLSGGVTSWSLTDGMVLWADGNGQNSFSAYYPAVKDFSLPADQSTVEQLKSADRMTAQATGTRGNAVSLSFTRHMAKATFNCTFIGGITAINSFEVSAKDAGNTNVEAYKNGNTCTAILAPGTYSAGEAIINIVASSTSNQYNFVVVTKSDLTIQAGKAYNFSLQVGRDAAEIKNVSVVNWVNSPLGSTDAESNEFTYGYDAQSKTLTVRNFKYSYWNPETRESVSNLEIMQPYFDLGVEHIIVQGVNNDGWLYSLFDLATNGVKVTFADYLVLGLLAPNSPTGTIFGATVTEANIPKLRTMGSKSIFNTAITSFEIPATVTEIIGNPFFGYDGGDLYDNPNLTTITVSPDNNKFKIEGDMLYNISNGKKLVADLKAYKSTASTVPQGATTIGDMAYYNCQSLTSVSLPSTLTSIGAYAFYDCRSLTSINIPNGVTSIEKEAFYCCSGLTSVTIPNSVISIGNYTFSGCYSLKTVYYEGTIEAAKNLFMYVSFYSGTVINCSDGTYTIS